MSKNRVLNDTIKFMKTATKKKKKVHAYDLWLVMFLPFFQGKEEGHVTARKFAKCFDILEFYSAYFEEVI